ncbi:MAG: hypothetical protein J5621_02045 [Paludibacteraceae bacterium]|nr:hypothetical protein [Paludibacteraceae bacterium]
MKALKNYRIKFHCQLGVIGLLATTGLLAICGEPDASLNAVAWIRTFGCQVAVCAICWLTAWLLCRRWGLNRKMSMLDHQQRVQR